MAALRYCQLQEATKQLHSNVQALQDNKCIFFCGCWREVRCLQSPNLLPKQFHAVPARYSVYLDGHLRHDGCCPLSCLDFQYDRNAVVP